MVSTTAKMAGPRTTHALLQAAAGTRELRQLGLVA